MSKRMLLKHRGSELRRIIVRLYVLRRRLSVAVESSNPGLSKGIVLNAIACVYHINTKTEPFWLNGGYSLRFFVFGLELGSANLVEISPAFSCHKKCGSL
jgi:hypothetical protein